MLVVFKGIKEENILIFDAEYNEGQIIQFSGILFKKLEKDIFQISKSLNIYIKLQSGEIHRFIREFTGITDSFLNAFGEELEKAREEIHDLINVENLVVVSHGLYNDRQTLLNSDIDLYTSPTGQEIRGLCTYNASKRILARKKNLRLEDVARDAGVFLSNGHNAFDDAWATVAVFSLLRKLEEEQKDEEKRNKEIL